MSAIPTPKPECTSYCCKNQLVIWAVPLSEGKTCFRPTGETMHETKDTTLEDCEKSCVESNTCGYFLLDDTGES